MASYTASPKTPDPASRPKPVVPLFGQQCISDLLPTLIGRPPTAPLWLPDEVWQARQVVVLVLDGLGRNQLDERASIAPTMAAMGSGWLTSVAPSTTAAALTSITTGVPPGEHGVVGYRVRVQGDVLNTLRWRLDEGGDARTTLPASEFQPIEPFLGTSPDVVADYRFQTTGFSEAQLRNGRWRPWSVVSGIVAQSESAIRAGANLVYAYYDGIDKVSHLSGIGEAFDLEVRFTDNLVEMLLDTLPSGTALVVTADHGQVHVGDRTIRLSQSVTSLTSALSGEGRFRWLHCRPNDQAELLRRAQDEYGDVAWVEHVDDIVAARWFGPMVSDAARSRLGDVALVPFEPVSFDDPADGGSFKLIGRHGSLTPDEMYVPLLTAVANG